MGLRLFILFVLFLQQSVQSLKFTVTVDQPIVCDQLVPVTATLLEDDGTVVPDMPVCLTTNGAQRCGNTNDAGEFQYSFNFSNSGSYDITGNYTGFVEFADWTNIDISNGIYLGLIAGQAISVSVIASGFSGYNLVPQDLSDPATYLYPATGFNTTMIAFNQDTNWVLNMNVSVAGLLLYMKNWAVSSIYPFNAQFRWLSPDLPFLVLPPPYTTNLNYTQINQDPGFAAPTFDGLLAFPDSLNSLSVTTSSGDLNQNYMTIALPPPTGIATITVQVSCCVNAVPTIAYQGVNWINNKWAFQPLFSLTGVPLPAELRLSYEGGTCVAQIDSSGLGSCRLGSDFSNFNRITLTAAFAGDGCNTISGSLTVGINVFGFGSNTSKQAFVVSSNTNLGLNGLVTFSGVNLLTLIEKAVSSKSAVSLKNVTGGLYVSSDLTTSKCSGTWNWTNNMALPSALPTNLGVLVSSGLWSNPTSASWNKILILSNITYKKTPYGTSSTGILQAIYCNAPLMQQSPIASSNKKN